jgi:hypothetical protein
MKKIITLTERDLTKIVRRVLLEVKTPQDIKLYTTTEMFKNDDYSCSGNLKGPYVVFNFSNLRKNSDCSLVFDTTMTAIHDCATQIQEQTPRLVKDGGSFNCNTKELNIKSIKGVVINYDLHTEFTEGQEYLFDICKSKFKGPKTNTKFNSCA